MYLIMLSSGEYSDRTEYQVGLVDTEEKAQGWVELLTRIIDRVEVSAVNKFHGAFARPMGSPIDPNGNWAKYRKVADEASLEIKLILGIDASIDENSNAWLTWVATLIDPKYVQSPNKGALTTGET
jgi:hypothetical protein